jgi:VWFA-related protein
MNPRCVGLLRLFVSPLIIGSLLVPLSLAQTTRKRAPNKPRIDPAANNTMKICQGVPIPPGYVVVAYMTTTACPHGAYLIKKQDSYSESVAEGYSKSSQSKTSAAGDSSANSKPAVQHAKGAKVATPPSVTNTADESATDRNVLSNSSAPANVIAANQPGSSRPRRVANATVQNNEVANITEDEPERPVRPPKWSGTQPSNTPINTATDVAADPGPEEVDEGDVIRVDTSFVTVPVSVLDRQGRFIPDLKREDFTVFENGVEQKIAYWEPADKPFTVALLLDTSPSTQFHLWQIKEAAVEFAKQLRPQDRVLIVSFNDQVLLLTEVTNDLNVINTVIDQYATMGSATRVYDAVHLVIKERLNKIKGRKAIVLFTDGVDTASSQADYGSTMREVEELDALIYPIQYDTSDYQRAMQNAGNGTVTVVSSSSGPFGTTTSRVTYGTTGVTGPNGQPLPGTTKEDYDRANRYLVELADRTGGRLYKANDTNQLADAFARIAEELRRQYSLGYYPQNAATTADRRQIKVKVNRPNLAVKARDSYIRATPAPTTTTQ